MMLLRIGTALSLLLPLGLGGCILVPIPRSTEDRGTRGPIDAKDVENLRIGSSTPEDVILELGEPDYAISSYFAYEWCTTRIDGYYAYGIAVPPYGPGFFGAGVNHQIANRYLILQFDYGRRLKRYRFDVCRGSIDPDSKAPVKSLSEIVDHW